MSALAIQHEGPLTTVTLTRPEIHNAFNEEVITELTSTFRELGDRPKTRVVVLAGEGKSFSAGADLHWMRKMVDYTDEENIRDARELAAMFETIDRCPKPVIARVQGAALGGGAGLVAVSDVAVASHEASFAFSEVRLGIIPAVISPYVMRRIGATHARRYFLTGERFDAARAEGIGLVSTAVEASALDAAVKRVSAEILRAAPGAVSEAKDLIFEIEPTAPADSLEATARRIATRRASAEGQEGMRAFLEKRPPEWTEA